MKRKWIEIYDKVSKSIYSYPNIYYTVKFPTRMFNSNVLQKSFLYRDFYINMIYQNLLLICTGSEINKHVVKYSISFFSWQVCCATLIL